MSGFALDNLGERGGKEQKLYPNSFVFACAAFHSFFFSNILQLLPSPKGWRRERNSIIGPRKLLPNEKSHGSHFPGSSVMLGIVVQ